MNGGANPTFLLGGSFAAAYHLKRAEFHLVVSFQVFLVESAGAKFFNFFPKRG